MVCLHQWKQDGLEARGVVRYVTKDIGDVDFLRSQEACC